MQLMHGRNFIHQVTDETELDAMMDLGRVTAYIGFDCTASSLHVGSLLQIMCLRLLQKHGHQPIVLLGGGTTRIGDPSGKEETRKILSEKQIEKNIKNIEKVFKIYLRTNNPKLMNKLFKKKKSCYRLQISSELFPALSTGACGCALGPCFPHLVCDCSRC